MLTWLWNFIRWIFLNGPWLIMAGFAVLALLKNRKSIPLILQILGALGYFVVAVLRWLIMELMSKTNASWETYNAAGTIFTFLTVVALLIFATGFCWEKFRQWRASPATVTATRVA